MTGARPPANSKEAQVARLIDLAREKHLTVYEISVEPRRISIRTQPLGESPVAEDAADRWLREQGDADKAGRRA